ADASLLDWFHPLRCEFGQALSVEVLEQLKRRDVEVFVPAGMRFFVGHLGDDMAGVASLLSLEGVGYVDNVVTLSAHRRRGVASAVVTSTVRAAVEAGDETVFLLTDEGGAPARLYERLGFRAASRVESLTRPLPT